MHQQQSITLTDGRQIGFTEYGDQGGTPIFYFHGFPGSRLDASAIHPIALANRCRLIGLDRPGMGLSSIDKKRTLLSWAMDVSEFADRLGIDKFSIMGHSGGGPFAAACAYMIPHRLNGTAIISGLASLEDPEWKIGMSRMQIIINQLMKRIPLLAKLMMRISLMSLKHPSMMDKMIRQMPAIDQAAFCDPEIKKSFLNSMTEAFRNGIAGPYAEFKLLLKPWGFSLKNIKTQSPVTIWHGSLDKQVPVSHAKIYTQSIPNAKLMIIENEGHISILKNHIEKILQSVSLSVAG